MVSVTQTLINIITGQRQTKSGSPYMGAMAAAQPKSMEDYRE